jgi:hypothetical protein
MNLGTVIGISAMHAELTGRLSTGLGCWLRSWQFLGCRVGRSRREGIVYVYVCVNDALSNLSSAISLVDVPGEVIFPKGRPF